MLHYLKDSKLWESWYIPYYGSCRIYIINRSTAHYAAPRIGSGAVSGLRLGSLGFGFREVSGMHSILPQGSAGVSEKLRIDTSKELDETSHIVGDEITSVSRLRFRVHRASLPLPVRLTPKP